VRYATLHHGKVTAHGALGLENIPSPVTQLSSLLQLAGSSGQQRKETALEEYIVTMSMPVVKFSNGKPLVYKMKKRNVIFVVHLTRITRFNHPGNNKNKTMHNQTKLPDIICIKQIHAKEWCNFDMSKYSFILVLVRNTVIMSHGCDCLPTLCKEVKKYIDTKQSNKRNNQN